STGHIGKLVFECDMNAQGEIACTGQAFGSVDFDPGAGTVPYTASHTLFGDFFVAHYSSTGAYIWHFASGHVVAESSGTSVRFDQAGNIYVTGMCAGLVDLDPSQTIVYNNSVGSFLAKYSGGALSWSRSGGENMVLDAADNVYLLSIYGTTCLSPSGVQYWNAPVAAQEYVGACVALSSNGKIHLAWGHVTSEDVDPGAGVISTTWYPTGTSYIVLSLVHLSTGTENESTETQVDVYPNPASQFIIITGSNSNAFVIYNSAGQQVRSQAATGTQTRMTISDLPAGVYFLHGTNEAYIRSFTVTR
ncbi:MAG TPA: T9SS type A sorting domain-containing protein, partial [Bacteroidia bacterium]|nr:T9SS type A sorting domain-containing protein [Bacteroidia bacterium]